MNCPDCGKKMVPMGKGYRCPNCGGKSVQCSIDCGLGPRFAVPSDLVAVQQIKTPLVYQFLADDHATR